MNFFEIKEKLNEINLNQIKNDVLTVGIVSADELIKIAPILKIDNDTIENFLNFNNSFRTNIDVRKNYSYAELRIVTINSNDDYIALFIMKNLLLIVDIQDEDNSTENSFLKALAYYPANKICIEKLIYYFVSSLLAGTNTISETLRNEISNMEEQVISNEANKDFNIELLKTKRIISSYYNYYNQILAIIETLEDNDNEILNENNIIYITNLYSKINRIKDDISILISRSDHLQDAYYALLDQRLNNTMKIFTIITTIFFPLTIIVGWYGMNFTTMPELTWKYGYLYVIILSITVIIGLTIFAKKKKWF